MASEEAGVDWVPHIAGPRPADLPYIRQSWLMSYRNSPWAGAVPNNLYTEVYSQAMDQLLFRGAKLVTIRNPANPEQLVAWTCYEVTPKNDVVIHFAFCKPTYRRLGAVKALLRTVLDGSDADRFFYTFRTPNARYFPNGTFRPEIARRRDSRTSD